MRTPLGDKGRPLDQTPSAQADRNRVTEVVARGEASYRNGEDRPLRAFAAIIGVYVATVVGGGRTMVGPPKSIISWSCAAEACPSASMPAISPSSPSWISPV
ncbi:MAG: hypothetical protein M3P85_07720 [Actinomycetota bacterium]|nr:hypothetical protein [Actinomycetota bacterium]